MKEILALFYLIIQTVSSLLPKNSGPTLQIKGLHGTSIYDSPEEEAKYKRLFRLRRIKERIEAGRLSLKTMQKLRAELNRMEPL